MRKKEMKKGELTTQQLVMIIVLVLSFAIILFFIFRLNLRGTTDKEICHDSVVKKSNPVLRKLSGELNCNTNYICISGGGTCKDITVSSTVNVDVNNKDEIFKAIADEMADCWWMFGEGKIDYGTGCAICSHIDFDDKIEEKYTGGKEISFKEFFDSLTKPMNVQESNENYLYYFYGISDKDSVLAQDAALKADYDNPNNKISLSGSFIIMTGMFRDKIFGGRIIHWILGESNNNYIVPYFPAGVKEPLPECGGNFLTKG